MVHFPLMKKCIVKPNKKGVELKTMKTGDLIGYVNTLEDMKDINAVIHITC